MAFLGIGKKKQPILPSLSFNNGQASLGTSSKTPRPALVGYGSPSGPNTLQVNPQNKSAVVQSNQSGALGPVLQQGATYGSTQINRPAPILGNTLQVGPGVGRAAGTPLPTAPKLSPTTSLSGTPTSPPVPSPSPTQGPSPSYSMQGSTGGGFSSYDPAVQASIKAKSDAAQASADAQRILPTSQPLGPTGTPPPPPNPTMPAGPSIIDQLRKRIGGLSAPGADEQALQDELAQFRGDAQLGIAGLEGQGRGIPLSLVRGQQAKLGEQAQLQEQTLMDRLAAMSSQRQAELAAAQNEYTIAANEQARQDQLTAPTSVGGSLIKFNPATGQYETVYSQAPQAQEPTAGIQEYEYAKQGGYQGSFLDYQAALQAQGASGGDSFSLSPGQVRYDANGNPIASVPATPSELSATDNRNLAFYNRALAAEADVQTALPNVNNLAQGVLPNFAQGSDYQQYVQAAGAWIKAVLRQESGAAIPPEEMNSYMKTYFPQVGDSAATIQQKAASRQQAINGLNVSGAGGGDEIDQFLDSFSSAPSTAGKGSIVSVPLGNKSVQVSDNIAQRLTMADADYFRATGRHIEVSEGLRSHERQSQLYNAYKNGTGGRAAPPGQSFHETGNAIDVSGDWKAAEPFLRKYGFLNNLADDRHHFSWGEFA